MSGAARGTYHVTYMLHIIRIIKYIKMNNYVILYKLFTNVYNS